MIAAMGRRSVKLLACFVGLAGCDEAPSASDAGALTDVPVVMDTAVVTDTPIVRDGPVVPDDLPPAPREPLTWDVRERGPYNVGYTTWSLTYTPPRSTTPRTIQLHAWYPTRAIAGPYPTYRRIIQDRQSIVDAPPAEPVYPMGYPVHVYSHGHQGFAATTHFLMRYFATHGWVALAPDHTGNTISDTPSTLPASIFYLRSHDITASLDALGNLPNEHLLRGRADLRRVLLSGHSFGSHTVWSSAGATFDTAAVEARCAINPCVAGDREQFAAGLRDSRIVAAIPMAGSLRREWFGTMGERSVMIPIFAMSGSDDPVGADTQFASTAPLPLTWIDVAGGCHQYFGLGGCTNIPDTEQPRIVGAYALALGRSAVLNDTDATVRGLLDNTIPLSARVTFRRR